LEELVKDDAEDALSTLLTILSNIEKDPEKGLYRQLRKGAKAIQRKIASHPSAIELLLLSGFKERVVVGEPYFVMDDLDEKQLTSLRGKISLLQMTSLKLTGKKAAALKARSQKALADRRVEKQAVGREKQRWQEDAEDRSLRKYKAGGEVGASPGKVVAAAPERKPCRILFHVPGNTIPSSPDASSMLPERNIQHEFSPSTTVVELCEWLATEEGLEKGWFQLAAQYPTRILGGEILRIPLKHSIHSARFLSYAHTLIHSYTHAIPPAESSTETVQQLGQGGAVKLRVVKSDAAPTAAPMAAPPAAPRGAPVAAAAPSAAAGPGGVRPGGGRRMGARGEAGPGKGLGEGEEEGEEEEGEEGEEEGEEEEGEEGEEEGEEEGGEEEAGAGAGPGAGAKISSRRWTTLLGSELAKSGAGTVGVEALAGKTVGMYFSAHW
jgi:hypothetical protein